MLSLATLVALGAYQAHAESRLWLSQQTAATSVKVQGVDPVEVYEKSYALVISESEYTNAVWDRLPNDKIEADNLANALVQQGFAVERMTDLPGKSLKSALLEFASTYGAPENRMIIFYTGHGYSDTKTLTGYLVPIDAVDPDKDMTTFSQQAVSTEDILGLSRQVKARHVLFLLDSCFSAAVFQTKHAISNPSEVALEGFARPARQFLTATQEDQPAPAVSNFEPALAEGIRGAADYNGDGVVTALELALWVKTTVANAQDSPTNPVYGDVQSNGGDMIFVPRPADNPLEGAPHKFPTARELTPPPAPAAIYDGLHIFYYRKTADGLRIDRALEGAHIPFVSSRSSNPQSLETNTIACSARIPAAAVKGLAHAIIESGFSIYEIQRFHKKADQDPLRVEVLNSARYVHNGARPLTLEQIDGLTECPDSLHN